MLHIAVPQAALREVLAVVERLTVVTAETAEAQWAAHLGQADVHFDVLVTPNSRRTAAV